ncbi:class I SAM-dependent methyltransferase [Bradyrhizobium sp. SYSU BS000235]|uniref:class I SAM-dependent methyltransferase n=1 Tax=Bradyrhizobium sp. SYSU BS000235 TaxID=3411332 RepID=UPI003C70B3E9
MRKLFKKFDMQVATVNAAASKLSDPEVGTPGVEVTPAGLRVIAAVNLGEDVLKRCGIEHGMRVFDLECGVGDASLAIADLVGPAGLVVGIDQSAAAIDIAERRATVAGQCYWMRFVTADLNTFVPPERFDAVVVRLSLFRQGVSTSLLRLAAYVRPYGVIVVAPDTSTEDADLILSRIGSR